VTYDCVIGVTNADYKLKPGMTANVSVTVAQREHALIIPNSALRFRPPDAAVVDTNPVAAAASPATNGSGRLAGDPGSHHGGGHGHSEHPSLHTIYLLADDGVDPIAARAGQDWHH